MIIIIIIINNIDSVWVSVAGVGTYIGSIYIFPTLPHSGLLVWQEINLYILALLPQGRVCTLVHFPCTLVPRATGEISGFVHFPSTLVPRATGGVSALVLSPCTVVPRATGNR